MIAEWLLESIYKVITKYRNIAIEGNIGAGKTTLAKKLANSLNANLILEEFVLNPFLPKFYKDPSRYAFSLEMSFLIERFHQQQEIQKLSELCIADYSFSKTLIFAKNNLDKDEFQLFERTFNLLNTQIKPPELIIYLDLSIENIQKNIKQRGRDYEQNIEDSYLESLQYQYLQFLKSQTTSHIIVLDINELDFLRNEDDFNSIIKLI